MFIGEFAQVFCQDLIAKHKELKSLIDLEEYPYDDIVEDTFGERVPCINIDSIMVPIRDLLTMDKVDFVKFYTMPHAAECYDNYIGNLQLIEGEEALFHIRKVLEAEFEALRKPTTFQFRV